MSSSRNLINVSSRQLQAFLEIARLRSFARAADVVHLSPSGISMLVKEMENQLGVRLFDRTTRSLSLTAAGQRLQPAAARIVAELRALGGVLSGDDTAVRARLAVAATPMVAASLLPDVIGAFAESHPQVDVQLADVDVSVVRQRVLEGEAELGLGFFVKPAVGLLRQPLCQFRLMHIAPPTAAGGRRPGQPWSGLAGLPLISLPADNPIQALIEKHLAAIGRAHEERPRMNLIGTLIAMVRAGRGHAIIPSFAVRDCVRQGLRVAMLTEPAVHIDLVMVTRRGTQPQPAAAAFAATLKQAAVRLRG